MPVLSTFCPCRQFFLKLFWNGIENKAKPTRHCHARSATRPPPLPTASRLSCPTPAPTMAEDFIAAVRKRLHPELDLPIPSQKTLPDPNFAHPTNAQSNASAARKRGASASSSASALVENPTHSKNSQAAEPPPKRSKKPTSDQAIRGARYRPHPSTAVLDRMQRSLKHRLFLITREGSEEDLQPYFAIMGANGNVYKCHINTKPSCTCPDFTKRDGTSANGPCKHLIFVFIRVLKLDKKNPAWWQVRLIPEEVKDVLSNAPPLASLRAVMAEDTVQRRYESMRVGNESNNGDSRGESSNRQPIEGDCPICFEGLVNADVSRPENVVTFCSQCGYNFHKACLQNWIRAQRRATCPCCRGDMEKSHDTVLSANEYTNLALYSTTHATQLTLAELYADTHQYIGRRPT